MVTGERAPTYRSVGKCIMYVIQKWPPGEWGLHIRIGNWTRIQKSVHACVCNNEKLKSEKKKFKTSIRRFSNSNKTLARWKSILCNQWSSFCYRVNDAHIRFLCFGCIVYTVTEHKCSSPKLHHNTLHHVTSFMHKRNTDKPKIDCILFWSKICGRLIICA